MTQTKEQRGDCLCEHTVTVTHWCPANVSTDDEDQIMQWPKDSDWCVITVFTNRNDSSAFVSLNLQYETGFIPPVRLTSSQVHGSSSGSPSVRDQSWLFDLVCLTGRCCVTHSRWQRWRHYEKNNVLVWEGNHASQGHTPKHKLLYTHTHSKEEGLDSDLSADDIRVKQCSRSWMCKRKKQQKYKSPTFLKGNTYNLFASLTRNR